MGKNHLTFTNVTAAKDEQPDDDRPLAINQPPDESVIHLATTCGSQLVHESPVPSTSDDLPSTTFYFSTSSVVSTCFDDPIPKTSSLSKDDSSTALLLVPPKKQRLDVDRSPKMITPAQNITREKLDAEKTRVIKLQDLYDCGLASKENKKQLADAKKMFVNMS